ncbi:MAG TPA: TIGR03435 family protein [Terracidiphilus sp.]|nr:TIGR03435 family protein [Terracidiphilus sp.]
MKPIFSLSKPKSVQLFVGSAAVFAVLARCVPGSPAWAQVPQATAAEENLPSLEFDVAAIKPHPQGASMNGGWRFTADSFSASNLTLKSLIFNAYDLKSDSQLRDLPKWGRTDEWDINAKIGGESLQELQKLDARQSYEEKRMMLRKLLATRFGLKIHRETKDLPIYELTVAKGGSKLAAAATSDKGSSWSWGNGRFDGTDVGADALAYSLSSVEEIGRLVVDKTGLKGKYDIKLNWTPEGNKETLDSGPSIFTALEEQLGLKLISAKGPVETIVVDHVERPTPN